MINNYLKIAIKVLFRRKVYTLITLIGISFTLMIVMLAISFWEHIQTNEKPKTEFDKVLSLHKVKGKYLDEKGDQIWNSLSAPSNYFIEKYVKTMNTPAKISSYTTLPIDFVHYSNGIKIKLTIKYTDSEFFEICDFDFLKGRAYNVAEFKEKQPIAIVDKKTADLLFPDEDAVGKQILIYSKTFEIVGVVDNVDILNIRLASNIYIPMSINSIFQRKVNISPRLTCGALIMAKSKNDFKNIKDEFQSVLLKVENVNPNCDRIDCSGVLEDEGVVSSVARIYSISAKRVLILVAVFFLILPISNLVNININRLHERYSEIGIRKSFGADLENLVIQFIIENIFIAVLGCIICIFLTLIVMFILNNIGVIPNLKLRIYPPALFYSFLITLLFGILSGAIPLLNVARLKISETLKSS